MPLFHVQDSDRPLFVIADSYETAVKKWRNAVASENDGDDPGMPSGVRLVADDEDIVVGQRTIAGS